MKRLKRRLFGCLVSLLMLCSTSVTAYAESGYNVHAYSDANTPDSIEVRQSITPSTVTTGAVVTYMVKPLSNEWNRPMPEVDGAESYTFSDGTTGISFSLKGGSPESPVKKTIKFDVSGISLYAFKYEVTAETVDTRQSGAEVALSKAVYTICVQGYNSPDGTVVKRTWSTSTEDGMNKHQACEFEHYAQCYIASDPPISKTITGDQPSKDAVFTFRMVADEASQPVPDAHAGTVGSIGRTADGKPYKDVHVKGMGEADFGDLYFYRPGTYSYTVYELDTGLVGYTYDHALYRLTYAVNSDSNGQFSAVRTMLKDGEEASGEAAFAFVNEYHPAGSIEGLVTSIHNAVNTGIPTSLALYAIVFLLLASLMLIFMAFKRRRKNEE